MLTFDNISILLEAVGTSWANIVRVGIFLADLKDLQKMNEIYQPNLLKLYPARSTLQADIAPGTLIEVDCITLAPGYA